MNVIFEELNFITISALFNKHIIYNKDKLYTREELIDFLREFLCDCFMNNIPVYICLDFIESTDLDLNENEYDILLNNYVKYPYKYTLLDIVMRCWAYNSYNCLHEGTDLVLNYNNYYMNKFYDVLCLYKNGSNKINAMDDTESVFFKMPTDYEKIKKIVNKITNNQNLINEIRYEKKINKKIYKYINCINKINRCIFYDEIKIKENKEIKNNKKIERRKERRLRWECSICLCNDINDNICLRCGHRFHSKCLLKYMIISNNNVCPYCRKQIKL